MFTVLQQVSSDFTCGICLFPLSSLILAQSYSHMWQGNISRFTVGSQPWKFPPARSRTFKREHPTRDDIGEANRSASAPPTPDIILRGAVGNGPKETNPCSIRLLQIVSSKNTPTRGLYCPRTLHGLGTTSRRAVFHPILLWYSHGAPLHGLLISLRWSARS